jgi:hypothetical protein
MNKIKSAAQYILGLAVLILGALFFTQRRKTESAESQLATEKANAVVKESDHDREIAKEHADRLVSDYESLKRRYDDAANGSGGDPDLS